MQEQHYLYILFSSTPYRIGSLIRRVTGERYNHVSLSLREDLEELYSFARRYEKTPFCGGFVTEHPSRYHKNGRVADVQLCRLPLRDDQYLSLQSQLDDMCSQNKHYLYNYFSAAAAPLHRRIPVRDAYTCVEFAVKILGELDYGFDAKQFYSVGSIARKLESYQVYTGAFPAPSDSDPVFFAPCSLRFRFTASTGGFLRLLWRAVTA